MEPFVTSCALVGEERLLVAKYSAATASWALIAFRREQRRQQQHPGEVQAKAILSQTTPPPPAQAALLESAFIATGCGACLSVFTTKPCSHFQNE
jgi:hypothetical protein